MNSIEARGMTIKYLEPFLVKNGFTIKMNKNNDATIRRPHQLGYDGIPIEYLSYGQVYKIRYGFNKIFSNVNAILLRLQEKVQLDYKEDRNSRLFFFSYNTINDPANTTYLPDMRSEDEIKKCVEMMAAFMEKTALGILDKFNDLKELDAVINGDCFWETDWHKPYYFVSNFYEKRIIVAKLAGNPRYEELVDFNYKAIEKLSAESGSTFTYDRSDMSKPLPALIKLLEDVKPL